MTPNPKPTALMAWATNPPAGALLQPPSALTTNGYSQNSKPAYNHFNWLLNNIGQWLAYLSTLDQSFTWQNNGLFSANPTIFGPSGTAADGSDARLQAAGAYFGFALYYSPLGPMPASAAWNAYYNDTGSNFLPYKTGTPAFRSFLDPATGMLRYMASTGVAATNTPLPCTDALAVARDGKVLVGKTTDDGSGALLQSVGLVSGQGFCALPVESTDFNGFYWNSFLSSSVGPLRTTRTPRPSLSSGIPASSGTGAPSCPGWYSTWAPARQLGRRSLAKTVPRWRSPPMAACS